MWGRFPPKEPSYGGKKLSVWLDEFPEGVHAKYDATSPPVQAVRAIGTDAIPWLLHQFRAEHRTDGFTWHWQVNRLLDKQHVITYRFNDPVMKPGLEPRLRRGIHGFEALGETAAPAIPKLLSLVERHPIHISATLVWMGPPAVPAVQQCLTNTKPYRTWFGREETIPNYAMTQLLNAHNAGRISKSDLKAFLPAIRACAQQTTDAFVRSSAQSLLRILEPDQGW